MTETSRGISVAGLLNQFEAIGGPEEYGPEGIAIMIALWRKSSKLGWKQTFQMTNTELTLQTGIKSRDTINTHRNKLVKAGLIGYSSPPRGSSRGIYTLNFDLLVTNEVVRELDIVVGEVVQKSDNFSEVVGEPVRESDHFPDTVLKDLTTTTTTTTTEDWDLPERVEPDPQADGMIAILNAYCRLNQKFDFHVRPKEREAMGKMVAGGMPVPFTIRTMEGLLQAKREREGESFKYPTSFLYYVDGIEEAWLNSQTASPPMAGVAPGESEPKKSMTKQQRELEDLRRRAKEARQRGESRSI